VKQEIVTKKSPVKPAHSNLFKRGPRLMIYGCGIVNRDREISAYPLTGIEFEFAAGSNMMHFPSVVSLTK
jgi:hypothetical protein